MATQYYEEKYVNQKEVGELDEYLKKELETEKETSGGYIVTINKEEKVVSNLVLRTLKVARYEAENRGHFGIASKYYCHFTSPIR